MLIKEIQKIFWGWETAHCEQFLLLQGANYVVLTNRLNGEVLLQLLNIDRLRYDYCMYM